MKPSLYICKNCKKIIEVVQEGNGILSCCNHVMEKLFANTTDASKEKHVPSYKIDNSIINISLGEIEHPMNNDHHISFVEIATEKGIQRKELEKNSTPKVSFD